MIEQPGVNQFAFAVDNFGTSYADGLGTLVSFSSTANTMGTNTQLLVGIAEDCYFLEVMFDTGAASAASWNFFCHIKTDSAAGVGGAGSSWTTLISNLACLSPQIGICPGTWYGFPLFIPKGSAIGATTQSATAGGGNYGVGVRCYGKPSRPDLCRTGTKVQTLGANAGTTLGTTFTPGTNAKGSWSASLGTLNLPSWWWQASYQAVDSTMQANSVLCDVAFDVTNKYLAILDQPTMTTALEQVGNLGGYQCFPPIRNAPAGVDVYIRGASLIGAPDSAISGIIYVVQ